MSCEDIYSQKTSEHENRLKSKEEELVSSGREEDFCERVPEPPPGSVSAPPPSYPTSMNRSAARRLVFAFRLCGALCDEAALLEKINPVIV